MSVIGDKKGVEFVRWFSELNKNSGKIAGGKGANLAEIFNLGINVPAGFVVTAQAYDYFILKAGLNKKISELLEGLDYENTKELDIVTGKIRELIVGSEFPANMKSEILDAYDSLNVDGFDFEKGSALAILNSSNEPPFVAVRSSSTAEDLAEASFAGQQDSFVNVKGNINLINNIKKCFASLYTSRATYYRNKKGFKHEEAHLSVVIQTMVDSDKSGVMFSKDPISGEDNVDVEAVWGLGEGIVSGKVTPDKYIVSRDFEILDKIIANKKMAVTRNSSGGKIEVVLSEGRAKSQVLKNHEIKKLAEIALKLEKHYSKPQDIEFAIEGSDIFIVQTRPITKITKKSEVDSGVEVKGDVVVEGMAASAGVASGEVKIIENNKDLEEVKKGDILVTKMTDPDMVVAMQKAKAIVTDEGGATSHAAIVSREMGTPCVVGTGDATKELKDKDIITVDGGSGKVYSGKVSEDSKKEVFLVDKKTNIEIKVMVDSPTYAERAAKSGIKKVGLTRIEGIIAEAGKHPNYFLLNKNIEEYEKIIYDGVVGISKYFDSIWVRTSDIRSDEFEELEGAPKRDESNPMLGMHGIRYSLKHPSILKAELKALKKVADSGKEIGVLLPQVILVEEVRKVKNILKEIDFHSAKVGVMVETPAAVQIISDLCKEGIDFISFGTNDLTQYILAVDRGNKLVQDIYDEMHPAVLSQLQYVLRNCKKNNVVTSICGQAGSKKEMVKFLVKNKIDSVSVNADVAKEISDYVYELENGGDNLEDEKKVEEVKVEDVLEVQGVDEFKGEEVLVEEKEVGSEVEEINEIKEEEFLGAELENEISEGGGVGGEEDVPGVQEIKKEEASEVKDEVVKEIKPEVEEVNVVEERVKMTENMVSAEERMGEIQKEIMKINGMIEEESDDLDDIKFEVSSEIIEDEILEIEELDDSEVEEVLEKDLDLGVEEFGGVEALREGEFEEISNKEDGEEMKDVQDLIENAEEEINEDEYEDNEEDDYDESCAIDVSSAESLIDGVQEKKSLDISKENSVSDILDIY